MGMFGDLLIRISGDASGAKTALRGVQTQAGLMGSALKAVFRTAVVAGFFMAIRSGMQVFQQAINFVKNTGSEMLKLNTAATRTATILNKGGDGFKSAFNTISKEARSLSTQSLYSATQIQQGFLTAAIAGYNLSDAVGVATSSMKLAATAGLGFDQTIEGLIGTVNAFGLGAEMLPQIADTIAASWSNALMTLEGFFAGMKFVATAAVTAFGETKQTLIDVAAAMMTLNDVGLQSSKTGVYLRATMLKLGSATSNVSAMLSKYNINLYKGTAENQKFIPVLTAAQQQISGMSDALIEAKLAQVQVAGSAGAGSKAFEKETQKVSKLTGELENLKKGITDIHDEFRMTGGEMRPLGDILIDMSNKLSPDVIGKVFGIRSSQGLMILLKQIERFKKHRALLSQNMDMSESGISINEVYFSSIMQAIEYQWKRITNSMGAAFSVIFDAGFEAFQPLVNRMAESFQKGYVIIEKYKSIFVEIAKILADSLVTPMDNFMKSIEGHLKKFPTAAKGEGGASPVNMPGVKKWVDELVTILREGLKVILDVLRPIFDKIADVLVKGVVTKLMLEGEFFIKIGSWIARGFIQEVMSFYASDAAKSASDVLQGKTISDNNKMKPILKAVNPFTYVGGAGQITGGLAEGGIKGGLQETMNWLKGIFSTTAPVIDATTASVTNLSAAVTKLKEQTATTTSDDVKNATEKGNSYWDNVLGAEDKKYNEYQKSLEDEKRKGEQFWKNELDKLSSITPPENVLQSVSNTLGSWKNIFASFKSDLRNIEQQVAALQKV